MHVHVLARPSFYYYTTRTYSRNARQHRETPPRLYGNVLRWRRPARPSAPLSSFGIAFAVAPPDPRRASIAGIPPHSSQTRTNPHTNTCYMHGPRWNAKTSRPNDCIPLSLSVSLSLSLSLCVCVCVLAHSFASSDRPLVDRPLVCWPLLSSSCVSLPVCWIVLLHSKERRR